jgi:tetratricopeptide (TPR) repeat protein
MNERRQGAGQGRRIEGFIAKRSWLKARSVIEAARERDPKSHWLLARLALTYYELRDYTKALELEIEGLQIAPMCPLLCWGYAGSSSMLGKNKEAIAVYKWLIERGVDELAYGDCGEGRGWARALVADSHYRISLCHEAMGERRKARVAMTKHLAARGPGVRSIYPIKGARSIAKRLGITAA